VFLPSQAEYPFHHQAAYLSLLPAVYLQIFNSLLHQVASNLRLTFRLQDNLGIRKGKDRALNKSVDFAGVVKMLFVEF
jgi:hypothetical protein